MSRLPNDLALTRKSLINRLKNWDDQEGWREFFDTYWTLIYRVARAAELTDNEAQDVVQETLIEVADKMKGFKYDPAVGSFRGWLLKLTGWRIKDRLRKRRRQEAGREHTQSGKTGRTPRVERVPDPASLDLDGIWEREWQQGVLDAAIERIKQKVNPAQYQLFDLCVRKEWPVAKIVGALGVTENQVYLAKSRVSELLKKEVRHLEDKML